MGLDDQDYTSDLAVAILTDPQLVASRDNEEKRCLARSTDCNESKLGDIRECQLVTSDVLALATERRWFEQDLYVFKVKKMLTTCAPFVSFHLPRLPEGSLSSSPQNAFTKKNISKGFGRAILERLSRAPTTFVTPPRRVTINNDDSQAESRISLSTVYDTAPSWTLRRQNRQQECQYWARLLSQQWSNHAIPPTPMQLKHAMNICNRSYSD